MRTVYWCLVCLLFCFRQIKFLIFIPHLKCLEINDQLNLTSYDAIKHFHLLRAGVPYSAASTGANVFSTGNR